MSEGNIASLFLPKEGGHTDNDLLKYFCKAAGHAECPSWEIHRFELDKIDQFVHLLIASIPDSIAIGKSVQSASKAGQTSLTEEVPKAADPVPDHRDDRLLPKEVHWYLGSPNGTDDDTVWMTADDNIRLNQQYYREDCRKVSILAYKPRRVQLFFDGIADEWNEWR